MTIEEAGDEDVVIDKVQSSKGLALSCFLDPFFCSDKTHVNPNCCDTATRRREEHPTQSQGLYSLSDFSVKANGFQTPEILEITECDEDVQSPKVSTVSAEESERDLFVCQKRLIQHVDSS